MSVLIKGLEMPTSCDKCPFLDYEEGFCFASGVKHKSGWYESTLRPGGIKDGRHEDCPLIPVPEHGRLIDADALVNANEKTYDNFKNGDEISTREATIAYLLTSEIIRRAKTIIPAEEGEG